jgi:hypothetical protein
LLDQTSRDDKGNPLTKYGPAFVNPYDPNVLYALTSSGIKVSVGGGISFQNELVLTALVTGSGKFPLVGDFGGGNGRDVIKANQSNANQMGSLSNHDNPNEIVATSPFTGVFYKPW